MLEFEINFREQLLQLRNDDIVQRGDAPEDEEQAEDEILQARSLDRGGVGGGDADDAKEGVRAVQANAPVTAWQIQGVRSGGRYLLGDATIDLTDREESR